MLSDVVDLLICPHCDRADETPVQLVDRTLRCPAGHVFDVARQGYVNLLTRAVPRHADTAAMVSARERFLATGAYAPLADELSSRAASAATLAEAGAGTGHYLAACLAARDDDSRRGLALDISPAAARRAARAHPRIGSVVADTWAGLPLRTGVVDVMLAVFAPRNPAEFARVLAPGGRVLVAAPLPEHLAELRSRLGLLGIEQDKENRLLESFAGLLRPAGRTDVRFTARLAPPAVADLVGMGPNAFHAVPPSRDADDREMAVRVAVRVHEFVRA